MSYKFIFHNFTKDPFIGYWNGKAYTFKPGIKKYYPELIARHFAKHLTNQLLIEKEQIRYTSPKKPNEVPIFMEIFNKAFLVEELPDEDNLDIDGSGGEELTEPSMNITTKKREVIDPYDASTNKVVPAGPPQVIGDVTPEDDTDESEYTDDTK